MPKAKDRKVWLLAVSHRHGNDYHVVESKELALELLHAYVKHWWDDCLNPPPQPKAHNAAIKLYFEECREDESWELSERSIENGKVR
jgi:hypothetical protein